MRCLTLPRAAFALLISTLLSVSGLSAEPSPAPAKEAKRAIARIWRGRTLPSKADEYEAYLNRSGISKIRETPGNLGAYMLRRTENGKAEFLVISLWESVEAIRRFAGPDYQKAVILPKDREYLLEVEPNVLHYEIVRADLAPKQPN
jgi:heme-degrading monooxygenase HmoA